MTFYQKVKKALKSRGPTTYPHLAQFMEADEEAVRLALYDLRGRGKAAKEREMSNVKAELWRSL